MTQYATAVIGAGVIGCLIARELAARDPRARITVLDRDAAGAGASRLSAGLHLLIGATPRLRDMSAHSHGYYAGLARRPPGLRVKKVAALHIVQRPGPGVGAVLFARDDAFLLPLAHRGHWLLSYCCQEWDVAPGELTGLLASDTAAGHRLLRHFAPAMTGA